jgi:uncharacterized protein (DUF1499 family)
MKKAILPIISLIALLSGTPANEGSSRNHVKPIQTPKEGISDQITQHIHSNAIKDIQYRLVRQRTIELHNNIKP